MPTPAEQEEDLEEVDDEEETDETIEDEILSADTGESEETSDETDGDIQESEDDFSYSNSVSNSGSDHDIEQISKKRRVETPQSKEKATPQLKSSVETPQSKEKATPQLKSSEIAIPDDPELPDFLRPLTPMVARKNDDPPSTPAHVVADPRTPKTIKAKRPTTKPHTPTTVVVVGEHPPKAKVSKANVHTCQGCGTKSSLPPPQKFIYHTAATVVDVGRSLYEQKILSTTTTAALEAHEKAFANSQAELRKAVEEISRLTAANETMRGKLRYAQDQRCTMKLEFESATRRIAALVDPPSEPPEPQKLPCDCGKKGRGAHRRECSSRLAPDSVPDVEPVWDKCDCDWNGKTKHRTSCAMKVSQRAHEAASEKRQRDAVPRGDSLEDVLQDARAALSKTVVKPPGPCTQKIIPSD